MKLGSKELTLSLLVAFLILSSGLILPVGATPCAILKVSLPAGTYVGYNDNPWLSECWLLNLTGASQTFTVRIKNTSPSLRSYDTHLVIALNDTGYNKLQTLVINGISVPKSAFKIGTPKPYNLWNWPSGDVYPTRFNDTYINVGLISKNGYKDLTVSVTFSDASGVAMHFDAYGSRSSTLPPPNDGYITHNGISEDSTVLLQSGLPPPQPPIANFFFNPYYPETNQVTTFNASESYDPDGYITTYAWNFSDGTPIVVENDPIAYHAFTNYGDFTVKLTITDNTGLTGEKSSIIHVSQHPIASFTFSPPDPLMHEIVTFDASASTPDGGTLVSYKWNFGDGNITTEPDPIITHAYATYGTYTITLNVTDSEGKWDTQSQMITVENAPIADFWWAPYYPQRDESVTFDASVSSPDGGVIISYAWDFGDGTPIVEETDPITTHSYTATGDYTVTLNVTDSEGRWDTESKIITVVARRYYLDVKTDPADIVAISGEGWYNEGTNVDLTAPDNVPVSTGVRYKFSHWDVDGTSKPGNPITVTMDANHTATAHYVLQYYLTVTSPYGTKGGEDWYNDGDTAYATVTPLTVSGAPGVQYVFTNWSGDATGNMSPSDPIIMNAPKTAIANWKTRYAVTFTQTGSAVAPTVTYTADVEPTQTVPFTIWVKADSPITYTYQDTVLGASGVRYVFTDVTPSSPQTVNSPLTVSGTYQIQYYLTVRTDPSDIATIPGEGWYNSSKSVSLTAPSVSGYTFLNWDVDGVSQGSGVSSITVNMNAPHVATAHYAIIPPSLSVSISPTSASIHVGQSTTFTSTVSGGTAPYSYQWYLNGSSVSGAISSSWTFSPTAPGTYSVYLKVTDKNSNTAQSAPATVNVSPAGGVPVGGYSISLVKQTPVSSMTMYAMLIVLFGATLSLTKRKRK